MLTRVFRESQLELDGNCSISATVGGTRELEGPALPLPAGNRPCAVAKGTSMWRLGSWLRAAALLGYTAAPGLRAYMWALAACSRARGRWRTGSAAEAQWTLSRVKCRLPIRRLSKLSRRWADLGATRERRAAAPPATDLPAGSHARGPGNARGHCKRDRDQRTVSTRTRTQQRPRRRSLSWLRDYAERSAGTGPPTAAVRRGVGCTPCWQQFFAVPPCVPRECPVSTCEYPLSPL